MSKIKVLVLNDLELKEKEIDNNLKALQNEVGGYIEIPCFSRKLSENNIDMIINEEGKVNRLQPQLAIYQDNKIVDVICGNIIFASSNEDGKTIGLTDEQIEVVKEVLKYDVICEFGFLKSMQM